MEEQSKQDKLNNVPHLETSYCFVVDFGQNMECPSFNEEQPGMTYYFSPFTVNNLGVVNHGHAKDDGSVGVHMHCHVYHEGVGKKGADNVASLIIKTLKSTNIIREDEMGKKLTIVFDNCTGQNKNNTVLKLVPFLVELGYFEEVVFHFLVVGHTKNSCDRYFNQSKCLQRESNSYTMNELCQNLRDCEDITIYETEHFDFLNWGKYLGTFYKDYQRMILQNHISRCVSSMIHSNKVFVKFKQSLLEGDAPVIINVMKTNFPHRNEYADINMAFAARPLIMKNHPHETLPSKGINPYKQYELFSKYRKMISVEAQSDPIYKEPDEDVLKKVKTEKGMRKKFREDLGDMKQYDMLEGDLQTARKKRDDQDKALHLLECIGGLRKK